MPGQPPRPYVRIQAMSDTIGARLRQARELRRITLQQASETTRVRIHYLQALESDDYSAIPSAAQARGFLRLYSEFLGLDLSNLLPAMQPAAPASEPNAAPPEAKPTRSGLWAGLRDRFARRPGKDDDSTSLSSDAVPETSPATTDVETTRRIRPASDDVKKNAAR